jgi:hypothetical protein
MKEPVHQEIGGRDYQIRRLDAMRQLHLSRRMQPLFLLSEEEKEAVAGKDDKTAGDAVGRAFSRAFGALSDQDVEAMIKPCLSVCYRKDSTGSFVPLMRNGVMMFDDLAGNDLLELMMAVLSANLDSFFGLSRPRESQPGTMTGS